MITKKRIKIALFTILSLVTIFILRSSYSILEEQDSLKYMDSIDYSETLDSLRNPERGFYNPIGYNLKVEDNQPLNSKSNLVHLRVGLGVFSSPNNNQEDLELSEDALNALGKTFQNIRDNNSSIIIRFAYDNFNGNANKEPSFDMILKHIEQIGPILLEYQDVIANIELGFFGPWGEMHSSKICTNENVSLAITKLLEATNQKIKISVRTPGYYAAWRKINRGSLDSDMPEKGTGAYQVGIFNDGYLGSETDLGTFANREIEVKWLSNQARHTFYGGEMVANFASGTPLNTIEYISKEAFLTHTTYLNPYWNDKVINGFKNTPYTGDDPLYKNETAYTYIENHLGYRFVLKDSYLTDQITKKDPLKLKLKIQNVGFANLINEKRVSIILKNEDDIYEIQTDLDATTWDSEKITEENFQVTLPDIIEEGNYDVYLRISEYGNLIDDSNYHCIQFANNNIYSEELGANYIGKVTIKVEETTPTPPSSQPPTSTPNPTPISTPTQIPTPVSTPTPTPTPTPVPTPKTTPGITQKDPIEESSKTIKKYIIQYYYDGVIDKTKTIASQKKIGSIIDSYKDKIEENYTLDKTENYPLTIRENENENIIRIYYVKEKKTMISENDSNREEEKKYGNLTIIALICDILLLMLVIIMIIRLLRNSR